MELSPEKRQLLEFVIDAVTKKIPETLGVYLFGSFGTPYETPASDLDIAILSEDSLSQTDLWNLSLEIARKINRDVQLISLRDSSTIFQNEIIMSGERVFCRDPNKCNNLENLFACMHLRLVEDRKEIIDDMRKQGHG